MVCLARLGLGAALGLLGAWLVGSWRPWALPGSPTLVPGEGQKHVHTVLVALWWAAAANACGIALLLATAGRWAREGTPPRPAATHRTGRATWLLLLGAAALAGVLRWPLAHGGLWLDETWNVRHTVVGKRDPAAASPERFDFRPVTWRETLWHYRAPTNHPAYSVVARLTTDAWRLLWGEPRYAFDEFALRLPAFAAALAAVVLVGVLVAELGFPRAAPVAALLLAIHPWHVRFGADGRAYAFVVLFALAGAWLLLRALRSGCWRWWLGYGLSQLLLLWSFPLAVHVSLALAVAGSVAIVLGAAPPGERGLQLARLVVANALAAMLFLQLMAPNLAQALAFRKEWRVEGDLGLRWYRVLWVELATGLKGWGGAGPDVAYPGLGALARRQPWLPAVVYGTTVGLAGLGLARVLGRGAVAERAVWAALALGVPLFLLHRSLQPFFVMWRFLSFGLAAVVPLLAVGLEGVAAGVSRGSRRAATACLALGIGAFAALVAPQLHVLLTRPISPSRELVAFLEQVGRGIPGGVLGAGLGLGGSPPRVYDPGIVEVRKPAELAALCERSRAEGRPLYVFYAYGLINERELPELFVHVADPRQFEPVARFDGVEADQMIRVLRYTGRPLED
jgi:hypothetical protein